MTVELPTAPPVSPAASPADELIDDLIDRYTENLMRAALSLGFGEVEAEELVQATFCAFLEGGARFERRSKILTYLFGILYNKARENRRYRDRHDSIDAKIDDAFEERFDATEHWNDETMAEMSEVERKTQSAHLAERLEECLEGLGAAMRMAFVLKESEQQSTEAVCQALGITATNLGVLLFRARNKLRECLTAKGVVIA